MESPELWGDFQPEGIEFLRSRRRAILADEMGLGKTIQGLEALKKIGAFDGNGARLLITVSGSGLYTWRRHLRRYCDCEPLLIYGNQQQRRDMWASKPKVALVGHGALLADTVWGILSKQPSMFDWDIELDDEVHKWRNRQSDLFKMLKHYKADVMWSLTGSPARRGPQDIWTMLNRLMRHRYPHYWPFVDKYCVTGYAFGGKEILGPDPKMVPELQKEMRKWFLRRLKRIVLPDLPPKIRAFMEVELDREGREFYNALADKLLAELEGRPIMTPTVLSKTTALRQFLTTPRLLNPRAKIGPSFEAMLDKVDESENGHFVLFSQFTKALDIFQAELEERGFKHVYQIRGGASPDDVERTTESWKAKKGVMCCSIQFAESFDLETAPNAYVLGAAWDPDTNEQAEDRLHRGTVKHAVNIWYAYHRHTVEDHLFDINNTKFRNVNRFLMDPETRRQLLAT